MTGVVSADSVPVGVLGTEKRLPAGGVTHPLSSSNLPPQALTIRRLRLGHSERRALVSKSLRDNCLDPDQGNLQYIRPWDRFKAVACAAIAQFGRESCVCADETRCMAAGPIIVLVFRIPTGQLPSSNAASVTRPSIFFSRKFCRIAATSPRHLDSPSACASFCIRAKTAGITGNFAETLPTCLSALELSYTVDG